MLPGNKSDSIANDGGQSVKPIDSSTTNADVISNKLKAQEKIQMLILCEGKELWCM